MSQLEKLKQLSEAMVNVVITEANPNTWPGAGKEPNELSKEERGDRYWSKKNANQVITTAVKLQTLISLCERSGMTPAPNQIDDVENKVIQFEKAARKRIEKIVNG